MTRRLLAAVLAAAGVACLLAAPSARAADVVATGWWSRTATNDPLSESPQALPVQPTTPDTLPVAAAVGEDQLLVEGVPDGATAIAAIRWQLDDGESSPTLTLPISPGSTVDPSSVVLACRAGAPWTPPDPAPGRWPGKPLTDPRACINGIIADDLSTISFGLQPLVRKDVLDVVLVPGRIADVPEVPLTKADGSSFHWVFDAPTPESLRTVASGFEQGAGSVDVTLAPFPEDTASAASGPSSPAPVASPTRSTGPVVAAPAPTGDSSRVAVPALDAQDLAAPVAAANDVQLAADTSDDPSKTVGVVLLLLAAAFGAWAYLSPESPELAAVGLGRFRRPIEPAAPPVAGAEVPEAPTGGLGRFARPRDEPPVPVN